MKTQKNKPAMKNDPKKPASKNVPAQVTPTKNAPKNVPKSVPPPAPVKNVPPAVAHPRNVASEAKEYGLPSAPMPPMPPIKGRPYTAPKTPSGVGDWICNGYQGEYADGFYPAVRFRTAANGEKVALSAIKVGDEISLSGDQWGKVTTVKHDGDMVAFAFNGHQVCLAATFQVSRRTEGTVLRKIVQGAPKGGEKKNAAALEAEGVVGIYFASPTR